MPDSDAHAGTPGRARRRAGSHGRAVADAASCAGVKHPLEQSERGHRLGVGRRTVLRDPVLDDVAAGRAPAELGGRPACTRLVSARVRGGRRFGERRARRHRCERDARRQINRFIELLLHVRVSSSSRRAFARRPGSTLVGRGPHPFQRVLESASSHQFATGLEPLGRPLFYGAAQRHLTRRQPTSAADTHGRRGLNGSRLHHAVVAPDRQPGSSSPRASASPGHVPSILAFLQPARSHTYYLPVRILFLCDIC